MKSKLLILVLIVLARGFTAAQSKIQFAYYEHIISGASSIELYLHEIKNKNTGIVANQSSLINNTHLVDTLLSLGVKVDKIFCPEHGFRGNEDAGAHINNEIDKKTGLQITSLYGSNKKPSNNDLENIDIVIFDLQDVGTRFYTYISTLTYVMEACAENNIPLIVLDRPNPNGYMIDGPVLDTNFRSFVGLHPVPVVYGMTIGEYAQMVVGEKWINCSDKLDLTIIPLQNYNHNLIVDLQVKPSPNLPNWQSVYLYPSLCLFEGTIMSVGRGTDFPFQIFGHPDFMLGSFAFIPKSNQGASNPKFKDQQCYGINLNSYAENYKMNPQSLNLSWLINSYKIIGDTNKFFNGYFNKLAGNDILKKQIIEGKSEEEIRKSWQNDIEKFKKIRSKYLIYD